jgi:hypothetical protein
VYSPQIHQDIARLRQADMRREAHGERLAAIAAAKPNGPGKFACVRHIFSNVAAAWRGPLGHRQPALDSAS